MKTLADITLRQLEAQRFNASYAARPLVTPAQQAQDLAQRMIAAIKTGNLDDARAHALALRPLLGFMPEGE
jgi:hypothetical protein